MTLIMVSSDNIRHPQRGISGLRFTFYRQVDPMTLIKSVEDAVKEISTWCEDQFGEEGYIWNNYRSGLYTYLFDVYGEKNVLLFKLRFG